MIFVVYHYDMKKYTYCFGSWSKIKDGEIEESNGPSFPDQYKAVAAVESESIDGVFHLTNHIDHNWQENDGVIPLVKARSTSVGDIVVDGDKKVYRCESLGWKEIKNEDACV